MNRLKQYILSLITKFSAWFHGKLIKDFTVYSDALPMDAEQGSVFTLIDKRVIITQMNKVSVVLGTLTPFGEFVIDILGYNPIKEE